MPCGRLRFSICRQSEWFCRTTAADGAQHDLPAYFINRHICFHFYRILFLNQMLFLRACMDADTPGKVFFSDQGIQKYLLNTRCFGRSFERIGLFYAVRQDGIQTAFFLIGQA
jgi:hypothetical protein